MNYSRMIDIVLQLIKKEYGIDIERAANITGTEVRQEIIKRTMRGENINDVLNSVQEQYVLSDEDVNQIVGEDGTDDE